MSEETPPEARLLRLRAQWHDMQAEALRLSAAMTDTAASMRRFAEAFQDGIDHELATHPDLAELNIQMDSFYAEG
ncbi:hypothetical protein [Rhodococcus qingshengii]|uniref:hypothetical protein n=1 Tax=Rhodococcus qingshengii TaxID=334542 RepID=UPI001C5DE967|nr:hypothetical protein [Rhodococcus qingshengii]MBW4813158.1 hypothetical protein [Rhodococcus qingshengii]